MTDGDPDPGDEPAGADEASGDESVGDDATASDETTGADATPDDGSAGDDPTAGAGPGDPDRVESDLGPGEVERILSVLDASVEALDREQFDRLLSVLEGVLANGSGADRETVAGLLSMLEELVVEPDDVDEEELVEALSVVEEVLAEPRNDPLAALGEGFGEGTGIGEAVAAAAEASGFGDLSPFLPAGDRDDDAASDAELFRIARIAAATTRRATGTSADSGVRAGVRMAHAAATERSPAELVARSRAIALDELGRAGLDVGDPEAWGLDPGDREASTSDAGGHAGRSPTREALRKRGERLLAASAEVGRPESPHPAFASILGELRPDEARILRLLATEGPQPRIELRDRGYLPLGSRPVAECLTMLGSDAGCRRPGRVTAYVENLRRLGLVALSADPVEDRQRYRILEAQSHVEAAFERATWPKSVYGSVRLTHLGVEFCETCFPFEVRADPPNAEFREGED